MSHVQPEAIRSTRGWWAALVALAGLVLSGFMQNVHVGFTRSGVFAVWASDLLAIVVWPILAIVILLRWKRLEKPLRTWLLIALGWFTFAAIVSAFRFATHHSDVMSLLIPKANLFAIWLIALLWLVRPSQHMLLKLATLFAAVHAGVAYYQGFSRSPWAFKYFQSGSIRGIILGALFPVVCLAVVRLRHDKVWRWVTLAAASWVLFVLAFETVITGSRVNSLVIPTAALVALVMVGVCASWWRVVVLVIAGALALPMLMGMRHCSALVRYGMERTPGVSMMIKKNTELSGRCFVPLKKGEKPAPNADSQNEGEKAIDDPEESKQESSNARIDVWKRAVADIKTNPIFGAGYRQYPVEYKLVDVRRVELPPHNVVLEYTLAYGALGLLGWLTMLVSPLVLLWRRGALRFRSAETMMVLSAAIVFFGIALVQPLMINPSVLVTTSFVLGVAILGSRALGKDEAAEATNA